MAPDLRYAWCHCFERSKHGKTSSTPNCYPQSSKVSWMPARTGDMLLAGVGGPVRSVSENPRHVPWLPWSSTPAATHPESHRLLHRQASPPPNKCLAAHSVSVAGTLLAASFVLDRPQRTQQEQAQRKEQRRSPNPLRHLHGLRDTGINTRTATQISEQSHRLPARAGRAGSARYTPRPVRRFRRLPLTSDTMGI